MISVSCRENRSIYNAYHLVKAFFKDERVTSQVCGLQDAEISVSINRAAHTYIGEYHRDESPDEESNNDVVNALNDAEHGSESANEDNKGGALNNSDIERYGSKVPAEDLLIEAGDIRELYVKLRRLTGRELPWGMLTGVRPVKLASKWLRENPDASKEAFFSWFYEERFVSRQKAEIAYDVALKEQELLTGMNMKVPVNEGYSLYVGVPFCPSVCSYCSFSSGAISDYKDKVELYLDALMNEIDLKAPAQQPVTIYIGGGTPTALSCSQLESLLSHIEKRFNVTEGIREGKILEYTVEAGRPDSITGQKLDILKKYGVTRISINPQSMQQKTLDAIGRKHSVDMIEAAFKMARAKGFDNINMDIIAGLPGEGNDDMRDTLQRIKALSPDSLTVHSLAVKRSSAIGISARVQENASDTDDSQTAIAMAASAQSRAASDPAQSVQEAAEDTGRRKRDTYDASPAAADIGRMISDAYAAAGEMGMKPYYLYRQKSIAGNFENTGYARPGREGLYNILIMEEVQSIIACGAGAGSKTVTRQPVPNPERAGKNTNIIRHENVKNVDEYIKRFL